jgi:hypothetical protein
MGTQFAGHAVLSNRHSRMLTYLVPSSVINVPEAFTALEKSMVALELDNYVICQPTLEQVFLGFTVEKDREHSHLTNSAEISLANAFDDTDVRIAQSSKSTCCFLERPQHKRNCLCLAPSVLLFIIVTIFLSGPIWFQLSKHFYGKNRVHYIPKRDRDQTAICTNKENTIVQMPELSGTFDFTLTHVAKLEAEDKDYCNGMVVPFMLNPLWDIYNFSIRVGVSGDLDSRSRVSQSSIATSAYQTNFANLGSPHIWNEQVRILFKEGHHKMHYNDMKYTTSSTDSFNQDDLFGSTLGQCGGCPNDRYYNGDTCSSSGRVNYGYNAIHGRCQADCATPLFESCTDQFFGHRDKYNAFRSFKDVTDQTSQNNAYLLNWNENPNNFTITAIFDKGVNIRSCESGFQVAVQIGVSYNCSAGLGSADCAPLAEYIDGSSSSDLCAYDKVRVGSFRV